MFPGIRSLAAAMHLEIHRVYDYKEMSVFCRLQNAIEYLVKIFRPKCDY
ncbi:hypothetical protein [Photorhabdus australis]